MSSGPIKEKLWYTSKELWLAGAVILNLILNSMGLPSLEVTPELMGAVALIFATLRTWWTDSRVVFS